MILSSYLFRALVLVLLSTTLVTVCTCSKTPTIDRSADTITTVIGEKVSVSTIRARLPASIASTSTVTHLSSRLYSLLPNGRLVSRHDEIHLNLLPHRRPVTIDPKTTHIVDNHVLNAPLQPGARIQYGDGLMAIFYGPHDELVHFTGPGIHLSQLSSSHQGIYLNTYPSSTEAGTFKDAPSPPDVKGDSDPTINPPTTTVEHVRNSSCSHGTPHYVEIALAFDHMLCRFYDGDMTKTLTIMHALISATSVPFLSATCIRLAVVHIDGFCTRLRDPYRRLSTLPNIDLASAFVTLWQMPSRRSIPRDVVYYVSGSTDGTALLGFSIPRSVCDNLESFGWVQGVLPGVLAHLLGRTLGARRTPVSEGGIMAEFYNWGPLSTFGAGAVSQMSEFVDSDAATCVTTEPPGAGATQWPVVTEAPPAVVDLPPYGTCAYNKPPSAVLGCTSATLGLVGRLSALSDDSLGERGDVRAGSLAVRMWQEAGAFRAEISGVEGDVRIDAFAGNQTTNGTLSVWNFRLRKLAPGTSVVGLRLPVYWLKWPRRRLSCCGERAYVYVHARWCRPRYWRGGERCTTAFRRLGRVMGCVRPCKGVVGGVVVPMSRERRCPSCKLVPGEG